MSQPQKPPDNTNTRERKGPVDLTIVARDLLALSRKNRRLILASVIGAAVLIWLSGYFGGSVRKWATLAAIGSSFVVFVRALLSVLPPDSRQSLKFMGVFFLGAMLAQYQESISEFLFVRNPAPTRVAPKSTPDVAAQAGSIDRPPQSSPQPGQQTAAYWSRVVVPLYESRYARPDSTESAADFQEESIGRFAAAVSAAETAAIDQLVDADLVEMVEFHLFIDELTIASVRRLTDFSNANNIVADGTAAEALRTFVTLANDPDLDDRLHDLLEVHPEAAYYLSSAFHFELMQRFQHAETNLMQRQLQRRYPDVAFELPTIELMSP